MKLTTSQRSGLTTLTRVFKNSEQLLDSWPLLAFAAKWSKCKSGQAGLATDSF